jgi:hypothetical protein
MFPHLAVTRKLISVKQYLLEPAPILSCATGFESLIYFHYSTLPDEIEISTCLAGSDDQSQPTNEHVLKIDW